MGRIIIVERMIRSRRISPEYIRGGDPNIRVYIYSVFNANDSRPVGWVWWGEVKPRGNSDDRVVNTIL